MSLFDNKNNMKANNMNSLERFEKAIRLEVPDRPPILYQHFGAGEWILRDLGLTMQKAHESPKNIVDCQARARQVFGHDNMIAGWGMYVESHALGSIWKWDNATYYYPRITRCRVSEPDDLFALEPPDPFEDQMMSTYIEALRLMVDDYASTVPVFGFVNSPLIAAMELRGGEALFMDMIRDPEFYQKVLELVTKTCLGYVEGIIKEAGVDGVLIEDGSLGGDQLRRDQAVVADLEFTRKLVESIKQAGRWVFIHNCSSEPYLDLHGSLKPDLVDFWVKSRVAPDTVKENLKGTCICTGVDGMSDMVLATPEQIEATILDSYHRYGLEGGFVIGSGGEIPLRAPIENVWAIRRAANKCHS